MSPISSRNTVPPAPLEQTGLRFGRARERALLVPKQLALQQALGDRRAVDGDERRLRARRPTVDSSRHHVLADAGLAQDDHADGALRGAGREPVDPPHAWILDHDAVDGGRRRLEPAQAFARPGHQRFRCLSVPRMTGNARAGHDALGAQALDQVPVDRGAQVGRRRGQEKSRSRSGRTAPACRTCATPARSCRRQCRRVDGPRRPGE